jgi:hypothetical protein
MIPTDVPIKPEKPAARENLDVRCTAPRQLLPGREALSTNAIAMPKGFGLIWR